MDTASSANLRLQPGRVSEKVTITADAALLKTDRADMATTFEEKQVSQLPILDRNSLSSTYSRPARSNWAGSTPRLRTRKARSRLSSTDSRSVAPGTNSTGPRTATRSWASSSSTRRSNRWPRPRSRPRIMTPSSAWPRRSGYRATKSGSNDYHGGLLVPAQRRDSARNPFSQSARNQTTGKFIPDTLRNQFGGAFGERIIKEQLFFFGDYRDAA